MTNSSVNRDSYNLVAANYAHEHSEELVWQTELDKFVDLMSSPATILDLGCGHGDETLYLASQLPTTTVIGIDFSQAMIGLAKAKGERAKFVVADIVSFKPDTKVQGIWARASLHHLSDEDLDQLFTNIIRYVDASFVLAMVNKAGDGQEVEEKQKYGTMLKRYFNYFTPARVQALAEKYSLKIIEQYMKPEGGHQFLVSYLCRKNIP